MPNLLELLRRSAVVHCMRLEEKEPELCCFILRATHQNCQLACTQPRLPTPPRPPHPLFHFGMTGAFTVKGEKRHKFVKFKVDEEWPPRFAKLELQVRARPRLN